MEFDQEYIRIYKKKGLRKCKKRFTKWHKIRASFPLSLFISLDPEDTFTICIGKRTII